ncbi:hypothetical protein RP20_CCG010519 [Aedes albopictus]|nr:hypothetical protein RP20_CCG010519 [Aedes albopictus]
MSDEPSSSVEFRREGGSTNDPPEGCRSRSGSSSSSGSLVGEAEEDYCENSPWVFIPEPMFTKIFLYLEPRDMLNAGQTCKRWNKLSRDDYIWRKYFQREFNVDTNIGLKPGAESWRSEFKRLTDNVPMVMTDVLTNHSHQVLHVSFSHNGKMFATCSKDGFVIVWNSAYPSTIRDSYDMRKLSWKYTQFSQFNQSDTLLLVSGVHFGSPHSTSGEIAVFTVQSNVYETKYDWICMHERFYFPDGFRLRCRVTNRPYDIFGTWFSDQHLLSGDLHWLAHLVSSSILWLNKANQEVDSEHTPIRNQLYKFYNRNASSIRAIMVANCPWLGDEKKDEEGAEGPSTSDAAGQKPTTEDEEDDRRIGNPLSHYQMNQDQAMDNMYRAGRGSYRTVC